MITLYEKLTPKELKKVIAETIPMIQEWFDAYVNWFGVCLMIGGLFTLLNLIICITKLDC